MLMLKRGEEVYPSDEDEEDMLVALDAAADTGPSQFLNHREPVTKSHLCRSHHHIAILCVHSLLKPPSEWSTELMHRTRRHGMQEVGSALDLPLHGWGRAYGAAKWGV
jgi:hypothetical protein